MSKDTEDKIIKYLFLDFETLAHINEDSILIEIAYELVDENLNYLKKANFMIDPGFTRFNSKEALDEALKGESSTGIKNYEFPRYYKILKPVLEDKNTLVICENAKDVCYGLNKNAARYGLDPLEFKAIDAMPFIKQILKTKSVVTSIQVLNNLDNEDHENEYNDYDVADGAKCLKDTFKKIVQIKNTKLNSLISTYNIKEINSKEIYIKKQKAQIKKVQQEKMIAKKRFEREKALEKATKFNSGEAISFVSNIVNDLIKFEAFAKYVKENDLKYVRCKSNSKYLGVTSKDELKLIPESILNNFTKIIVLNDILKEIK